MSKLAVGIASFQDLRSKGFLYVDKTMYIQRMLENGKSYFLSRPRRFGKSLFVTMLEAYFRGQRELFHGLAIEEVESRKPREEQWVAYPVMELLMAGGNYRTDAGLEQVLAFALRAFEEKYGIAHYKADVPELRDYLPLWLKHCLEKGHEVTGRQVVFLVDEYDKPLLDNISVDDGQEARNRELLRSFFSVLKDEDNCLKFAFFTGVTKFNKVSIFSDLNQLKDITLLPKYSAVCGITPKELEQNFAEDIQALAQVQGMSPEEAKARLAKIYDGYHFSESGEGVYNPFSLLNAFSDERFGRYWFESATPAFLVRELVRSGIQVRDFAEGVQTTEEQMNNYRAGDGDVVPLFFQTGYLTITGYDPVFQEYTLSYPNDEVRFGFLESLIPRVSADYAARTGTRNFTNPTASRGD